MIQKYLLFLSALFVIASSGAYAGESARCLNTVCFDSMKTVSGKSLGLRGIALHEFLKIDMYTGALYLPEEVRSAPEALQDVPKALVLNYHRPIKVSWMNRVARKQIQKNPAIDYEVLQERIETIGSAYQPVKKNDRYTLIYEPGRGTSLYRDEAFVIQIPGVDFQKAYFGVWLSEYPASRKFRDQLFDLKGDG